MLVCLSVVLNLFERMIPLAFPAPGAKLGLANMVVLTALYILPARDAFLVVILKSVMASWIFASFSAFLYSIAGSLLSFAVMLLIIRLGKERVGPVGVSVAGGVCHNIGQLLMAALIIQTTRIFGYLPFLMAVGAGTGILVGATVRLLLKYLRIALDR
jgi:heptaprenyl diphosphate synthase